MPRPIILGVVGDSAAGKTTMTRGLVRILGEEQVTAVSTDDYHRYDRKQRAERRITLLHPNCNYLDIISQHLRLLRQGEPILKPVYVHADGTFGPPVYVDPKPFTIVEGLLGYHSAEMRHCYDVRVYLAPPEQLRRRWKVRRDTSRRGYTTDQVLKELDKREPDSAEFIRPQERHADMVVAFQPDNGGDPDALDAEMILRDVLPHPDLSPFIGDGDRGITLDERGTERHIRVPGQMDRDVAAEIEEAMGKAALRDSPTLGPARRVHDRDRPTPVGVAGARAAPDSVPPRDGQGRDRIGRRRTPGRRPGRRRRGKGEGGGAVVTPRREAASRRWEGARSRDRAMRVTVYVER